MWKITQKQKIILEFRDTFFTKIISLKVTRVSKKLLHIHK